MLCVQLQTSRRWKQRLKVSRTDMLRRIETWMFVVHLSENKACCKQFCSVQCRLAYVFVEDCRFERFLNASANLCATFLNIKCGWKYTHYHPHLMLRNAACNLADTFKNRLKKQASTNTWARRHCTEPNCLQHGLFSGTWITNNLLSMGRNRSVLRGRICNWRVCPIGKICGEESSPHRFQRKSESDVPFCHPNIEGCRFRK